MTDTTTATHLHRLALRLAAVHAAGQVAGADAIAALDLDDASADLVGDETATADPAADVRALARLGLARLPDDATGAPPDAWDDVLSRLRGRSAEDRPAGAGHHRLRQVLDEVMAADAPTASGLAAAIAGTAAPPVVDRPDRPSVGRRRMAVAASAVAVLLATGASLVGTPTVDEGSGRPTGTRPTTTLAPPLAPIARPAGELTTSRGRFEAGAPGDVVLVAATGCRSTEEAFVLRPSTGAVYRFSHWPADGEDVAGSRVRVVPGARTLTAVDGDGDGCLEVVATGGGERAELQEVGR